MKKYLKKAKGQALVLLIVVTLLGGSCKNPFERDDDPKGEVTSENNNEDPQNGTPAGTDKEDSGDTISNGDTNGSYGPEITKVVIREKAGISSTNYPLTFGHVFKQGDIPPSYTVQVRSGAAAIPTQFDIKSTYPDGSVRHGVISIRIPQVLAFSDNTLSIVSSSSVSNNQGLNKEALLATDIGATLALTGLNGSGHSGSLSANLRDAISQAEPLEYWLRGGICTEILVRQDLSNSLNALWEVRVYPGTPYIRISHTIENINLNARGNVNYALEINQGKEDLARAYQKPAFQHNQSSRWRKVLWLGEEPPEVEIRFDLPYMISTGMILPYDTSLAINENAIASYYTTWLNSNRDIMGNGTVHRNMPEGAGRPDIGMLPKWTAMYLLTMDNRMRDIMLGNGEASGSAPIHYREGDLGRSFYGHTVSIDDRPTFYWLNNYSLPSIGTTGSTGWSPDMAHQPSLVYIPYLITGERWFLDELYYWAGFNLYFAGYRTPGTSFRLGLNESFGRISGQLRGIAWGLRTVSDAAAIAYDGDIEKEYFRSKLSNNLEWLMWRNDTKRGHGLNAVIWSGVSRGTQTGDNWAGFILSPWQHDFMVLSVAHIARQHADLADAALLRDTIGKFTVNRFLELPPYRGVAYRMPLADLDDNYYTDGDWARYAADILKLTNNANPQNYFNGSNYSYSYAAIALGASALMSHLDRGRDVYDFIKDNLNYNVWARDDPTWSFVPLP